MGDSQSWRERGNLGPRDVILHKTVSRSPVANKVVLGSWTVDICQEGRSQRSAPQRRHMAHLWWHSHFTPRNLSGWNQEDDKMHRPTWGECARQAPGHLSCLNLGWHKMQAWLSLCLCGVPENLNLSSFRPGKCRQPRACFIHFPCRATWNLSSVDQESTDAMSGGKHSVAQTLWALPTCSSVVCLQCSSVQVTLNKWPPLPPCVRVEIRHWRDLQTDEAKIHRGNLFGSDRGNRLKPCT